MKGMKMSNVPQAPQAARVSFAAGAARLVAAAIALAMFASVIALPARALAAGPTNTYAPQTGTYVFDERGLLSPAEFSTIEAQAQGLVSEYNLGVYFLTTSYMDGLSDPTSSQRTSYATTYYKEHKLGLNPTGGRDYGDGILFVIAADSRDYVTVAFGQGSYSFSDEGVAAIEDAVLDNIRDHKDDWYGAAETFYHEVGKQLDYYDRHGQAQTPLDLFDYILRIAIILGVPALIVFFVIRSWRAAMKTAREQSEAGYYLDPSSLQMIVSSDEFVNTTMAVTPRPKSSDNDSGGWGGGGGGDFSSSGGGKF